MDEQLDNQNVSDDPKDYDAAAKDEELTDKPFICVMCKMHKTWTVGEQEFMANLKTQGLIERVKAPKRCSDCRAALKRAA